MSFRSVVVFLPILLLSAWCGSVGAYYFEIGLGSQSLYDGEGGCNPIGYTFTAGVQCEPIPYDVQCYDYSGGQTATIGSFSSMNDGNYFFDLRFYTDANCESCFSKAAIDINGACGNFGSESCYQPDYSQVSCWVPVNGGKFYFNSTVSSKEYA